MWTDEHSAALQSPQSLLTFMPSLQVTHLSFFHCLPKLRTMLLQAPGKVRLASSTEPRATVPDPDALRPGAVDVIAALAHCLCITRLSLANIPWRSADLSRLLLVLPLLQELSLFDVELDSFRCFAQPGAHCHTLRELEVMDLFSDEEADL